MKHQAHTTTMRQKSSNKATLQVQNIYGNILFKPLMSKITTGHTFWSRASGIGQTLLGDALSLQPWQMRTCRNWDQLTLAFRPQTFEMIKKELSVSETSCVDAI